MSRLSRFAAVTGPDSPEVGWGAGALSVIVSTITSAAGTLSAGDSGFLTYYASEDYTWNEDRDYLYPVPYEQRKQTGLALTQNPGWDDGL